MWLIKRVYMDGAGHEEAFYKDLTLDYIGLSQAVSSPVVEGLRSPVRNATVVTSTYQQLVNGGGKSTYIALLLSIFEPSVSDFTQYLANHRQSEYHYRNYFYKELSVVLVEMVNESGQTLLLGHAHQRNGDDVDRTLFICDAPDSLMGAPFDEVLLIPARNAILSCAPMPIACAVLIAGLISRLVVKAVCIGVKPPDRTSGAHFYWNNKLTLILSKQW